MGSQRQVNSSQPSPAAKHFCITHVFVQAGVGVGVAHGIARVEGTFVQVKVWPFTVILQASICEASVSFPESCSYF
jgi:hypothetical protein